MSKYSDCLTCPASPNPQFRDTEDLKSNCPKIGSEFPKTKFCHNLQDKKELQHLFCPPCMTYVPRDFHDLIYLLRGVRSYAQCGCNVLAKL